MSNPVLVATSDLALAKSVVDSAIKRGLSPVKSPADGDVALAMIECYQVSAAVVDLRMPSRSAILLIEETIARGLECRFVVVGDSAEFGDRHRRYLSTMGAELLTLPVRQKSVDIFVGAIASAVQVHGGV